VRLAFDPPGWAVIVLSIVVAYAATTFLFGAGSSRRPSLSEIARASIAILAGTLALVLPWPWWLVGFVALMTVFFVRATRSC
jgi:hypothetical protein